MNIKKTLFNFDNTRTSIQSYDSIHVEVKRNRSSYLERSPRDTFNLFLANFDTTKGSKQKLKQSPCWGWDQRRTTRQPLFLQLRPYPTITLFGSAFSHEPIKFKTKDPEHCCRHGNGSFLIWLTSMITNRFKPDLDRWYHSYSDDVTPSHHSYWQMYTMQSVFVNKTVPRLRVAVQ